MIPQLGTGFLPLPASFAKYIGVGGREYAQYLTSVVGANVESLVGPSQVFGEVIAYTSGAPGNIDVEVDSAGLAKLKVGGVGSRRTLNADLFSLAKLDWEGDQSFVFNNAIPALNTPGQILYTVTLNAAIVPISLLGIVNDADGDLITVVALEAMPAGTSINVTGEIIGTPTVAGAYEFDCRWTDAFGEFFVAAVQLVVEAPDALLAPNVVGVDELGANQILLGAGLVPVRAEAPSATVPVGFVASQVPAAGTPITAGQIVTITISLGNIQAPTRTGTIPNQQYVIGQPITPINVAAILPGATAFAVVIGTLPLGLLLNAATGFITGSPVNESTAVVVVRGLNVAGFADSNAFQILTVTSAPLRIVIQLAP